MERGLTKKGLKSIKTMGSYLMLRGIKPDLILSSCSLRAQETADGLAEQIDYEGKKFYLKELYLTSPDTLKETLMMQDNQFGTIFVVGHNPQLTDFANMLSDEHISKIPTLGIVALKLPIDDWSELDSVHAEIDFFIYPKQFKYFMPKQIRAQLGEEH